MTRILLATILCALAWHASAGQRQYAADLWRDVAWHVEGALP